MNDQPINEADVAVWFRTLAEKLHVLLVNVDDAASTENSSSSLMDGVVQGMRVHARWYEAEGGAPARTRVVACPDHPRHAFAPPREERYLHCADRLVLEGECVLDHDGLSDHFVARILPRSPYHVEIECTNPLTLHRFERLIRATIAVAQAVWSAHWKWEELARALRELGMGAESLPPYIFLDVDGYRARVRRIDLSGSTDAVRIDALKDDGTRLDLSPLLEVPGVLPGHLSGVHLAGDGDARFVTSEARAGAIRYAVLRLIDVVRGAGSRVSPGPRS